MKQKEKPSLLWFAPLVVMQFLLFPILIIGPFVLVLGTLGVFYYIYQFIETGNLNKAGLLFLIWLVVFLVWTGIYILLKRKSLDMHEAVELLYRDITNCKN